jgi:LPXTG-motif cell wall-anchored protein
MKIRGCSVLAFIFSAALAHATILSPGGSPPVAASAFGTPVTGPFLADTGLQNFTGTNSLGQTTISGEYRAMVYSDPGNDFCAGCLDFFVVVESNSSSTDAIERITLASFGSFLTNVGYSVGKGSLPSGIDPTTVDRSSNGSVVGFNFSTLPGVAPGDETEVLEIQTNATSFMKGTLQIIDSSVASVTAFEPCLGTVPEASSISMTLLGGLLLGLGFIGRRRRTAR